MKKDTLDIHREIIERCKAGERKAFFEIYTMYSRAMLNTCFRIVNNREEAEDILQESFISAFKNLHQFKNDSTFGAWLKKIVINYSLNALKKRKNIITVDVDKIDLSDADAGKENLNFKIETVKEELKKLPDGYRIVLSLYLIEGYEHKEIAAMLGISISTSLSQYHRAKEKLREALKNKTELRWKIV